jgi:hypothetical protein
MSEIHSVTPVLDPSLEEFLRKSVELLCGRRKVEFQYEKELRLCQFKVWLLEDDKDLNSIRDGGMIFAAMAVSAKMRDMRAKHIGSSPSAILESVLKVPAFRLLFDYGFADPKTLYDLSKKLPVALIHDSALESASDVSSLNMLTLWRLRIAKTVGLTTSLAKGVKAHMTAIEDAAEEEGKAASVKGKRKDKVLRDTRIREIHRDRVNREAFLYVASGYCPEILDFPRRPGEVLTVLTRQAKEAELFQKYFALCQSALGLLEVKSPSAATLGGWSGVPALPLDDVAAIPDEDQDRLGLKAMERRPAEETKRSRRQTPLA